MNIKKRQIDLNYDPSIDETRLSIDGNPISNLECFGSGKYVPIKDWIKDFFPEIVRTQRFGPGIECTFKYHGTPSDYAIFEREFANFEEEYKKNLGDGNSRIIFKLDKELSDISDKYREKIKNLSTSFDKIKKLFPDKERQEVFKKHEKAISVYEDNLENRVIQVAVVGAVKAGKSTLMNAILGDEIAPFKVTPETAVLTIFKASDKNYVKVFFYSENQWEAIWDSANATVEKSFKKSKFIEEYNNLNAGNIKTLWLNQKTIEIFPESIEDLKEIVKKHSSKTEAIHYFVEKLEIGLKKFGIDELPLPRDISFVDTPGLDDVVVQRTEITKNYISSADAVIVCVLAKTFRNDEYKTILGTFENIGADKNKVVVLGTQLDSLNETKDEWKKLKEEWHNNLGGLYKNEESLGKNVIGVSARIFYLLQLLKNNNLNNDNFVREITTFAGKNGINILPKQSSTLKERVKNVFSPFNEKKSILNNFDVLLTDTGIKNFLDVLKSGPLSDPEKVRAESLEKGYTLFVAKPIKETVLKLKQHVEDQRELLNKSLEEKQAIINEKQQKIDEIQSYRTQLDEALDTMEKNVKARVEQLKTQFNEKMKKALGGK
jgi:GTPase SAR1 family protein